MRRQRTINEQINGEHLRRHLLEIYPSEEILELEVTDRPDFAFQIANITIAIELAQIPGDYITRHYYKREKETKLASSGSGIVGLSTIWPIEPHTWVHRELARKAKRIDDYRARTSAHQVWLALHANSPNNKWILSSAREWQLHMLRFGASKLGHLFDRVLMIFPDGLVKTLFAHDMPRTVAIEIDFSIGYPTQSSEFFSLPIEFPPQGSDRLFIDYGEIMFRERIVRPLSPELQKYGPRIDRPRIFARSTTTADKSLIELTFSNGFKTVPIEANASDFAERSIFMDCLLHLPTGFLGGDRVSYQYEA